MLGNRAAIVNVDHFEAHGGTTPDIDQGTEHPGLQDVVVGVVMFFT